MQIKVSFILVLTPDLVFGFHLKITPEINICLFGFPTLSIAFHKIATKKSLILSLFFLLLNKSHIHGSEIRLRFERFDSQESEGNMPRILFLGLAGS